VLEGGEMRYKTFGSVRALVMVMGGMFFAFNPLSGVSAQPILDSDDFEYVDSVANHGWTIPSGNPSTAVDPEDPTNRAVLLLSVANTTGQGIERSLGEISLEPGMRMSIRF
jgi:hypothetical protein